jgi:hypothetical protein
MGHRTCGAQEPCNDFSLTPTRIIIGAGLGGRNHDGDQAHVIVTERLYAAWAAWLGGGVDDVDAVLERDPYLLISACNTGLIINAALHLRCTHWCNKKQDPQRRNCSEHAVPLIRLASASMRRSQKGYYARPTPKRFGPAILVEYFAIRVS